MILRKLITILRKQFTIYREIDTRYEYRTETVSPQRKYEQSATFESNEVKSQNIEVKRLEMISFIRS